MKQIFLAFLVCFGLAGTTKADPYKVPSYQSQRIKEKIIEYGEAIKVLGIPVRDVGTEYYFRKPVTDAKLSEEDIQRIVDALLKALSEDLADDKTEGENPEVVAQFQKLVEQKCYKCHTADDPGGSYSFVSDEKFKLQNVENEEMNEFEIVSKMRKIVKLGKMPKSGPLTDEEFQVFENYFDYLTDKLGEE